MSGALGVWVVLNAPAWACGGFFCSTDPVEQTDESIVFEVDDDEGVVTMHVQVAYEGTAEAFAWVLPVPSNPETFISTPVLFSELDRLTQPAFTLRQPQVNCYSSGSSDSDTDADADSDADTDTDTDTVDVEGVEVVSSGSVGPYDQTVLRANDSAALVTWLQLNGYLVPSDLEAPLGAYLGPDTHFVAVKLSKGNDAGDLAPLGLRYTGTQPMIPIGLTAIAAAPDMPLRVYLLGEHRGVPLNYLHVQISPLAMPWFSSQSQLDGAWSQVAGVAADEAGGHAFVTTFAQDGVGAVVYRDNMFQIDGLDASESALQWFLSLDDSGFSGTAEVLEVFRLHVPAPDGVSELDFYNCPECYADAWADLDATFDPVAATSDLELYVVGPRRDAQSILDANAYVTRLDTQLSPSEMTVDPRFGFNPDLDSITGSRQVTVTTTCEDGQKAREGLRDLTLATGHVIALAPDRQTPPLEQIFDLMVGHTALIIEQLSESGPAEVLVDHSGELDALVVEAYGFGDTSSGWRAQGGSSTGTGSGCTTAPALPWLGLVGGLGLAALVRRRRTTALNPQ